LNTAQAVAWLRARGVVTSRRTLDAMHGYIFDAAGCQLAVMRVAESNEPMRRSGRRYGYSETLIPRLRGRDEAEAIMTLTDDAWRASRFHKRGRNSP